MMQPLLLCAFLLTSIGFAAAKPDAEKDEDKKPSKAAPAKKEKQQEAPNTAEDKTILTTAREQADKCAQALVSGDFDTVIDYTHERVLKAIGGREAMIAMLKKGTEEMKSQDAGFSKVEIGEPAQFKHEDSWLITLIPQHITMKVKGGTLLSHSSLIGISADEGKKWTYVDATSLNNPQFGALFPELKGKLEVPEQPKPEFTPSE